MKMGRASNPYYYSEEVDGESSWNARMYGKARKQGQRETGRPYCPICDAAMAKALGMSDREEGTSAMQLVVGVVEKKEIEEVEEEGVGSGATTRASDPTEGNKGEEEEEKGSGDKAGDHSGGENAGNSDGDAEGDGVVDMLRREMEEMEQQAREVFCEWNTLSGTWGEWNCEGEEIWREWVCFPYYWDSENSAYYYRDLVVNDTLAVEWLDSLWVFDDEAPKYINKDPNPNPEA